MKTKATKTADLEALRGEFAATEAAFIVEFKGLTVIAVNDLRKKVREAGGSYRVVKNTLARKAVEGTGIAPAIAHFKGPTAIVKTADPARVAKTLNDFAKANPAVVVKGGVVERTALNAAECKAIADLPTKEQLIAKLLFLLQSPMQRLVTVLSAPHRNLAIVLGQVAEKKTE
jgi:large subunit ribosomal protein L10